MRHRRPSLAPTAPLAVALALAALAWCQGCSNGTPRATYSGDVAAIVDRSCVPCHRTDSVAPFALQTYEQVKRRSSQIAQVVESRYMPPWRNELEPDQIDALVSLIDTMLEDPESISRLLIEFADKKHIA